MLFDGWDALSRTLVVGVLSYVALVGILRASGKRTLSKLNAFDLVVTVALGSTLATMLLSRDTSLAQGVLAFALLAALQHAITWSTLRARWVDRIVKAEPRLLLRRGTFLREAMRGERVTEDEVRAAVRAAGLARLDAARSASCRARPGRARDRRCTASAARAARTADARRNASCTPNERTGRDAAHPEEGLMSGLVWLGILLLAAWAVLWLGFNIVSGIVHLLVVVAIVLLAVGLLRRGARAVDRRL